MTDFVTQQDEAWHDIYVRFKGNETPNGPGSFVANTQNVRAYVPEMLERLNIRSMLDAPCGDLNWWHTAQDLPKEYQGWDGQPGIIAGNRERYQGLSFDLVNLLTVERFPTVELILCRDFMIHLPVDEIATLLAKFAASDSHYLLATNYPNATNEFDCPPQGHDDRPGYFYNEVCLTAAPFNMPAKIDAITEDDGMHELALFDLWDF